MKRCKLKETRHNGRSGKDDIYNPLHNDRRKEDNFSFNQIELAYYVEHYSDYVMNQNARHAGEVWYYANNESGFTERTE